MSALPLPVHPGTSLWLASELGTQDTPTLASGHAPLDAELPGGGWPLGSLIDLLQPPHGQHEARLLLPALGRTAGVVVLVGNPHLPHLVAWAGQGVAASRVLQVQADPPAERLWAAEQALRCHDLGALLVWLPQATPAALRRLQLAARAWEAADRPPPLVVALRPATARHQACAAPLRLVLESRGRQGLVVEVFKRRGPPLLQPLRMAAELPVQAGLRRGAAGSVAVVPHVVDRLRTPALA